MSRTAGRGPEAPTTDRDQNQDRDDASDRIRIQLGTYREDDQLVSGTYCPEHDVVLVKDSDSNDVVAVSRATWLDWSHGRMIDRVARQRRAFVRDGDLLEPSAVGN